MYEAKRVLIVDDLGYFAKALAGTLNKSGYVAVYAESSQQALALLKAQSFDVVLTDVRMPTMSGQLLAQAIREKSPTPVIMMSGYGKDLLELKQDGAAVAFLSKPFTNAELLEALKVATTPSR